MRTTVSAASPYKREDARAPGKPRSAAGPEALVGFSRLRVPILFASALLSAALAFQLALFGVPLGALGGAMVLGAFGGLLAALFFREPVAAQRVFIGLLVGTAASFILGARAVLGAWAQVANGFIVAWDVMTQGYVLPFRIDAGLGIVDVGAVALCFAAVASLLVWIFLRLQKSALVLGVCTFLALATVFAGVASFLSLGLILGGGMLLASLLAMVKKQTSVVSRLSVRGFLAMVPPLVVALLLALGVGCAVARTVGDQPAAAGVRAGILQAWDEMRFGSDTLPEGRFAKAYQMNRVGEGVAIPRLEATFSSAEAVVQSYFRGFVGSSYTGVAFDEPSFAVYDGQWNGLFGWMEGAGFSPLLQSAQYAQMNCAVVGQQLPTSTITLQAEQANRRYGYAPYQTLQDPSAQPLLDLSLQPEGFFGLGESSLTTVPDSQATELFSPAAWVSTPSEGGEGSEGQFLQAERAYRSFVYDTYLEGSESSRSVIQRFFFSGEGWDPATKDLYSIATRIRSMLESHCAYTSDPAPFQPSANADYVTWFLETEKQGNASAFAATAVLAFREAGVPARYVEGYLLSQANVDALKEAAQATAQMTARDAHAWVEVYIDGVGWTPLEMTPGFYDKTYAAEQTIEISKEVAGDGSESELSGSLDRSWDDWIPEELRPFAWIGLLLLLVIIALVGYGIVELQRFLRVRRRERYFAKAVERAAASAGSATLGLTDVGETQVSALLFARLQRALRFAPVAFDGAHPGDYEEAFSQGDLGVTPTEYRRMIELIERERFGGVALNAHEEALIQDIICRIEAALWRAAPRRQHLSMRYRYLFELPL